jgi:hypothetical protein
MKNCRRGGWQKLFRKRSSFFLYAYFFLKKNASNLSTENFKVSYSHRTRTYIRDWPTRLEQDRANDCFVEKSQAWIHDYHSLETLALTLTLFKGSDWETDEQPSIHCKIHVLVSQSCWHEFKLKLQGQLLRFRTSFYVYFTNERITRPCGKRGYCHSLLWFLKKNSSLRAPALK